jgi:sec-independent protein translocase protein TatB
MFDLGAQELIVIFIVAFLVFGPKRLPELGRTLGKGIRELKAAMRNVKDSLEESELNVSKEIKEVKTDLQESIKKATEPEAGGKPETEKNQTIKQADSVTGQSGEDSQSKTAEEKEEKPESEKDG